MSTTFPRQEIKPAKNAYPPWLAAQLRGENVATPQSVIDKYHPKIEPTLVVIPGKTLFAHENVPALYVPPPMIVKQTPKMLVKFKVLNAFDKPIFGFSIRANKEDLLTDSQGNVSIIVYQGHNLVFSTGRESGWSLPNGAKRKVRMTGMIPIAQSLPMKAPSTVYLFPESGEFKVNGVIFTQPITYTPS